MDGSPCHLPGILLATDAVWAATPTSSLPVLHELRFSSRARLQSAQHCFKHRDARRMDPSSPFAALLCSILRIAGTQVPIKPLIKLIRDPQVVQAAVAGFDACSACSGPSAPLPPSLVLMLGRKPSPSCRTSPAFMLKP